MFQSKWNDFPCSHFLCFDRNSIEKDKLDFTPIEPNEGSIYAGDIGSRVRDYAINSFTRDQWELLEFCTMSEFQKRSKIDHYSKGLDIVNVSDQVNDLLMKFDFIIWRNQRFAIHMSNFKRGLTNLSSVEKEKLAKS